jgi:hypothetical protein
LSGFPATLTLVFLVAKTVFDDISEFGIDLFKRIGGPAFQECTVELWKHLRAALFR